MCELNNFLPMLVLPKCIYCKTQQTYVYRQDYQMTIALYRYQA